MSVPQSLPPSEAIPQLSALEQTQVLDMLFEPCVQLHELSLDALRTTRFLSYNDLATHVGQQLTSLGSAGSQSALGQLDAILSAHPRLGEKKVDSQQSRGEQAHLQQSSSEEAEELAKLNQQYEKTFPGLRYVVFVNGRPRTEIFSDMRHRMAQGNIEWERAAAIKAMVDIAKDRASKLIG